MSLLRSTVRLLRSSNVLTPQIKAVQTTRNIHRWVSPTLKEIKKRKKKVPVVPVNRTTFTDWNYNSELFAFSKRLHEEFNPDILQQAFTHRSYIIQEEKKQLDVGIENPITNLKDNTELAREGAALLSNYVNMFVVSQLPRLPKVGVDSVREYLLSNELLANVSTHIGTKDLILSDEFPPADATLAFTLQAVIGALYQSSGSERTFEFVRDFVCTQLNQKDIDSIWQIERPIAMLQEFCRENKFGEPEPRLIGETAKNTILATSHVGIYCDRKLLGTGFGENVNTAIEVAAINCLKRLCDIENPRPYNYKITLKELESLSFEEGQRRI